MLKYSSDAYYDDWYDADASYRPTGEYRDLLAEMEASWRRLCDACNWNYDGTRKVPRRSYDDMTREDARLENFYAGGL